MAFRANCFSFGGRKAGRYEITVDGRNPAHQLRGSFKGGNLETMSFSIFGKMIQS